MLYNKMSMLPMDRTDVLALQLMRVDAELDHYKSTATEVLASLDAAAAHSEMLPVNKSEWDEVAIFRGNAYRKLLTVARGELS